MFSRPTKRVVTRLLFVVALAIAVLAPASAAFAGTSRQTNYPPTTPTTQHTTVQGTSATDSTLPFTGSDVAPLIVLGAVLLGGGVLLVWTSRRRSRSAA